jgi:DNA repair exonuclease SbcCD ATPase subunit
MNSDNDSENGFGEADIVDIRRSLEEYVELMMNNQSKNMISSSDVEVNTILSSKLYSMEYMSNILRQNHQLLSVNIHQSQEISHYRDRLQQVEQQVKVMKEERHELNKKLAEVSHELKEKKQLYETSLESQQLLQPQSMNSTLRPNEEFMKVKSMAEKSMNQLISMERAMKEVVGNEDRIAELEDQLRQSQGKCSSQSQQLNEIQTLHEKIVRENLNHQQTISILREQYEELSKKSSCSTKLMNPVADDNHQAQAGVMAEQVQEIRAAIQSITEQIYKLSILS